MTACFAMAALFAENIAQKNVRASLVAIVAENADGGIIIPAEDPDEVKHLVEIARNDNDGKVRGMAIIYLPDDQQALFAKLVKNEKKRQRASSGNSAA